mgnify:FL=1
MFAKTGGIPVNNKAGRVIKLPPPANEFKPPAKNAAKQTKNKLRISTLYSRPSTTTTCLSEEVEENSKAIL